jgi:hypothetical protein
MIVICLSEINGVLSLHVSTSFRALPAGFRTFLAVLHFMLAAFKTARFTQVCAQEADFFRFLASKTHQLSRSITQSSAFHIKLDAFCHHLYVLLFGAGRRAVVTDRSTFKACFNTVFVSVITVHIL